jgi:hypothetical protein
MEMREEASKWPKVNLPLPDGRLRLFLEGKEDWLEEELLLPVKSSSTTQEGGA